MKEVRSGTVSAHPDRSLLWAAQTPQVVLRQAWLDAARMSDGDETDAAAGPRGGGGHSAPEEAGMMRIGQGEDLHRIDDDGDAGEVLEGDAGRGEGDFTVPRLARLPVRERLDVVAGAAAGQHQRDRGLAPLPVGQRQRRRERIGIGRRPVRCAAGRWGIDR